MRVSLARGQVVQRLSPCLREVRESGSDILQLREALLVRSFTVACGPAGTFFVVNKEVLIPEVLWSYPEFEGRRSIPIARFVQLLRQLTVTFGLQALADVNERHSR
jgi:hypothetical protein